jgi:hypothetical protein
MDKTENLNKCVENSKLWSIINKLKKAHPNKQFNMTPEQRFNLCNYINGKPFNAKLLREFIKNA